MENIHSENNEKNSDGIGPLYAHRWTYGERSNEKVDEREILLERHGYGYCSICAAMPFVSNCEIAQTVKTGNSD